MRIEILPSDADAAEDTQPPASTSASPKKAAAVSQPATGAHHSTATTATAEGDATQRADSMRNDKDCDPVAGVTCLAATTVSSVRLSEPNHAEGVANTESIKAGGDRRHGFSNSDGVHSKAAQTAAARTDVSNKLVSSGIEVHPVKNSSGQETHSKGGVPTARMSAGGTCSSDSGTGEQADVTASASKTSCVISAKGQPQKQPGSSGKTALHTFSPESNSPVSSASRNPTTSTSTSRVGAGCAKSSRVMSLKRQALDDDDSSDDSESDASSDSSSTSSDQDSYVVEHILASYVWRSQAGSRQRFYFVKWQGYSSLENTWEPEEHVKHCAAMSVFQLRKKAPAPPESALPMVVDVRMLPLTAVVKKPAKVYKVSWGPEYEAVWCRHNELMQLFTKSEITRMEAFLARWRSKAKGASSEEIALRKAYDREMQGKAEQASRTESGSSAKASAVATSQCNVASMAAQNVFPQQHTASPTAVRLHGTAAGKPKSIGVSLGSKSAPLRGAAQPVSATQCQPPKEALVPSDNDLKGATDSPAMVPGKGLFGHRRPSTSAAASSPVSTTKPQSNSAGSKAAFVSPPQSAKTKPAARSADASSRQPSSSQTSGSRKPSLQSQYNSESSTATSADQSVAVSIQAPSAASAAASPPPPASPPSPTFPSQPSPEPPASASRACVVTFDSSDEDDDVPVAAIVEREKQTQGSKQRDSYESSGTSAVPSRARTVSTSELSTSRRVAASLFSFAPAEDGSHGAASEKLPVPEEDSVVVVIPSATPSRQNSTSSSPSKRRHSSTARPVKRRKSSESVKPRRRSSDMSDPSLKSAAPAKSKRKPVAPKSAGVATQRRSSSAATKISSSKPAAKKVSTSRPGKGAHSKTTGAAVTTRKLPQRADDVASSTFARKLQAKRPKSAGTASATVVGSKRLKRPSSAGAAHPSPVRSQSERPRSANSKRRSSSSTGPQRSRPGSALSASPSISEKAEAAKGQINGFRKRRKLLRSSSGATSDEDEDPAGDVFGLVGSSHGDFDSSSMVAGAAAPSDSFIIAGTAATNEHFAAVPVQNVSGAKPAFRARSLVFEPDPSTQQQQLHRNWVSQSMPWSRTNLEVASFRPNDPLRQLLLEKWCACGDSSSFCVKEVTRLWNYGLYSDFNRARQLFSRQHHQEPAFNLDDELVFGACASTKHLQNLLLHGLLPSAQQSTNSSNSATVSPVMYDVQLSPNPTHGLVRQFQPGSVLYVVCFLMCQGRTQRVSFSDAVDRKEVADADTVLFEGQDSDLVVPVCHSDDDEVVGLHQRPPHVFPIAVLTVYTPPVASTVPVALNPCAVSELRDLVRREHPPSLWDAQDALCTTGRAMLMVKSRPPVSTVALEELMAAVGDSESVVRVKGNAHTIVTSWSCALKLLRHQMGTLAGCEVQFSLFRKPKHMRQMAHAPTPARVSSVTSLSTSPSSPPPPPPPPPAAVVHGRPSATGQLPKNSRGAGNPGTSNRALAGGASIFQTQLHQVSVQQHERQHHSREHYSGDGIDDVASRGQISESLSSFGPSTLARARHGLSNQSDTASTDMSNVSRPKSHDRDRVPSSSGGSSGAAPKRNLPKWLQNVYNK